MVSIGTIGSILTSTERLNSFGGWKQTVPELTTGFSSTGALFLLENQPASSGSAGSPLEDSELSLRKRRGTCDRRHRHEGKNRMYETAHAMNLCEQTESSKSGGMLAAGRVVLTAAQEMRFICFFRLRFLIYSVNGRSS